MKTRSFTPKGKSPLHLVRDGNKITVYVDAKSEFRREAEHVFETVTAAKDFMNHPRV